MAYEDGMQEQVEYRIGFYLLIPCIILAVFFFSLPHQGYPRSGGTTQALLPLPIKVRDFTCVARIFQLFISSLTPAELPAHAVRRPQQCIPWLYCFAKILLKHTHAELEPQNQLQ